MLLPFQSILPMSGTLGYKVFSCYFFVRLDSLCVTRFIR